MQAQENRAVQRRQRLEVIDIKRNPYLVDYEEQKRRRRAVNKSPRRPVEAAGRRSERPLDLIEIRRGQQMTGRNRQRAGMAVRQQSRTASAGNRRNTAAAKKRRRKQVLRQKMMAAAWILCIFMIGWLIFLKKGNATGLEQSGGPQEAQIAGEELENTSSVIVQGISSEQFKKHPVWTENFLPVNEYSRPGETLSEVRDIFVHYTANPGTSAAQNRSYFEQQKDMHEASVSAHFIIGCDGEIIQCVPLDEIAYAVQTRNYDSVSIECCYKAPDGSFTQETYDSLISLLAWLTDTYGLDTSHILRHYDCGGKKCPLYYTEHTDAWARLKEDVAAKKVE